MIVLGLGWFGVQFFWAFYSGSMSLYLKNFVDTKFAISLVLSLAGVSGCVVPPIAGYLSDRTNTRFGRRRPYVFIGTLGMFFCMLGLPYLKAIGLIAVVSAFSYFFIDFAMAPYWALLPDITPADQRGTTSGVMNFLGGIGLIAYFFISSKIWDSNPVAVFHMVAFVGLCTVFIAIAVIREPQEGFSAPAAPIPNPLAYLKSFLEEKNVLIFFGAQFFWWLGFWVIQPFLTPFAVETLNVSEGTSLNVPLAASVVSTIVVVPLGMLGDRLSRKLILSGAVILWAAAEVAIGFSQNLTHAVVCVGIVGIPIAAAMAIGYAYMLDLVPEERTAEFVGLHIFSMAAPQIFGSLIGGKLIDTLGYHSMFTSAAVFSAVAFIILQFVKPDGTRVESSGDGLHS
jgi:MFS family permease